MDTLWQDLRSTLQTLGEHPGLTLAAVMSLSLGIEATTVQRLPDPRHDRQIVHQAIARPHPFSMWMDYIDFRHGSGDVLRRIGCDVNSFNPAAARVRD